MRFFMAVSRSEPEADTSNDLPVQCVLALGAGVIGGLAKTTDTVDADVRRELSTYLITQT
jgi:hypothetical protein